MSFRYVTLLYVSLFFLLPEMGYGQLQIQHSAPTVIESDERVELNFDVPGLTAGDIQQAYLFYRSDGEVSYQQISASFNQGSFRVLPDLSADISSSVEYYFVVRTSDGQRLTYPGQNPSEEPVQVEVVEKRTAETDTAGEEGPAADISYNILSPEPDSRTSSEDIVVAVTFFYEDTTLERGQFQLHLDGENVTDETETDSYFLSYVPEQIRQGEHHVEVLYELDEQLYKVTQWQFTVASDAELSGEIIGQRQQENFTSGRVQFSARNQHVARSQEDILRGRVEFRGRKGDIRYSARGNLTTQESSRLQPQNRFGAELLIGDWAELRGGDFYEQMSRLTLGGQRVRGINAKLNLLNENINGMFLYGRMRRSITNLYMPVQASYDTVGVSVDRPIVDSTYTLSYGDQGRGTYQRDIIGGRLSFGDRTPIQWGLNAIKVEDDTNSIDPVEDFIDARSRSTELVNQLSQEEIQYLRENPEELSVASSAEPKGNFVTSTDLSLNLDRNRIRFDAEVGASLLNDDIDGGYLTRERAEDLGLELDSGTEDLLSQLSWLIIVNENMNTLPFQFEETGDGSSELQPFVPKGIFGGRSRASFNYFDHRLQIQYRWMGPNYHSLANSTIRKDLAGFNVSDRFRVWRDQLYITLGYEQLENNVLDTRDATTRTSTYRTNVSWYPISRDLPRISTGIRLRDRGNGVARSNPALSGDQLFASVRNIRVEGSDTLVTPRPVQSFTTQLNASITQQFEIADIINDASFNISYLHTEDNAFTYGGLESMSYSLQIQNRYTNLPLDTHIGFNLNQSDSRGGLASFDIFGITLGGTAFLMDDRLRLSGRLAFSRNTQLSTPLVVDRNEPANVYDNYYRPDTGERVNQESNTYVVNLNARYQLAAQHALLAQSNFTNVVALDNRRLPNDRILELRYIFEF